MNLMQTSKKLDEWIDRINRQDVQHYFDHGNYIEINAVPKNHIYIPSETAKAFHNDDTFVRLAMGPFGSGKSTFCAHEIVKRATAMPYWSNGRRKARCVIVRNTSGELVTTVLQTWLSWFGDLGDIRKRQKPVLTLEHTFNDGKGIIELELVFLALDRPDDVKKLKSMEATFAYLNELNELPEAILSHIKGRVNGRYPSKQFCPESYWGGIICDTNPPDEDSWIYNQFVKNPTESYKIFKQPPGLIKDANDKWIQNPNCDNGANLSPDYYEKLAEGQKEGFIKVYCLGHFGLVETGKRVYPEYNDDIHSVSGLKAIQGLPIHLGWDFGLTPACVVFQFTPRGQFRVLKEYVAEGMGIRTFAKNIVMPGLMQDFPYNKVGESEGDPAGVAGDVIMEELSCIGELNNLGIKTNPASTNDLDVRIGAVRFFLNNMIDGAPGFLMDRENCPTLRKGFMSGYHYKRVNVKNDDRYQDKPNKNKFSHPHDGLQYGAMKFASEQIVKDRFQEKSVDMFNPVFQWQ